LPSPNVIDNYNDNDLANYLNQVLPFCESGKFAIGYFFISGLNVILKNITHLKELRLLISNTTDQKTAETLVQAFKRLEEAKEILEPDKFQNQTKIKSVVETKKNNLKVKEVPIRAIYTDYSRKKGQKNLNSISIMLRFLVRFLK